MKKHQEPKHWLLQGRNENINLIVLILTLAWSFHIWVVDKSINYTSFLHLTCSNQGFQTLSCLAQQWSWPPIFWGNHSTVGKRLSVFLIPILIRSDFTHFPFIHKQYGLGGIGMRCDSSHLSWPRHSWMCFASARQTTKLQGALPTYCSFPLASDKNKQTRKAFFFIFLCFCCWWCWYFFLSRLAVLTIKPFTLDWLPSTYNCI